ncbi:MAG: LytTR family transcriptional regulator [Gemmatimonadetes bacterium]|nr:LytTR family transcriptional regulator [Gemmatimonadota bacterium]
MGVLLTLAMVWTGIGAVTGLQLVGVQALRGGPLRAGPLVLYQLLAAWSWIPVSLAAIALTLRVPPSRTAPIRTGAVHLAAGLACGCAVTLLMSGLFHQVGSPFAGEAGVWREAWVGTVRWAHVNLLVYGLLVVLTLRVRRRRGSRPDAVAAGERTAVASDAPVAGRASAGADAPTAPEPRIAFRTGSGVVLLTPEEIRWLEADGDYVRVHASTGVPLVNHRLDELEATLSPHGFVRIHRSTLVNAARVRQVRAAGRGDRDVLLDDGTTLRLARRRAARLGEAWWAKGP